MPTNPFVINYESKQKLQFTARLYSNNGSEVDYSTLWQADYTSIPYFKYNLYVAVPTRNEAFYLKLYAKMNPEEKFFKSISQMNLIRTESDQNDAIQLCQTYETTAEYYIYSPLEFNLKQGQLYEFNYFIKDALKVALADNDNNWYYLERSTSSKGPNVWTLKAAKFNTLGELSLYAKFDLKSKYKAISFYNIVPYTP